MATPPGFDTNQVWAIPVSLAATQGVACCFLFLGLLRCFNSPGSLYRPYFIQAGVTLHDECRVSPFGHPRIKACLAAPRGLSQLTTSFIGSRRQGIHRWLFVAWKNKDARARYAIIKGRKVRNKAPHTEVAEPWGALPGNGRENDDHESCIPSRDPRISIDVRMLEAE